MSLLRKRHLCITDIHTYTARNTHITCVLVPYVTLKRNREIKNVLVDSSTGGA